MSAEEPAPRPFWKRQWNIDRYLLSMIAGLCVVVLAASVVAFFVAGPYGGPVWEGRRMAFDAERWRNDVAYENGVTLRLRIADDLVATQSLVGLTQDEVIALLGEPTSAHDDGSEASYDLGTTFGYMMYVTERRLRIEFGEGGRVSTLSISEEEIPI